MYPEGEKYEDTLPGRSSLSHWQGPCFRSRQSEWCVCLLLFALVASLELVNTAIEAVVDLVTEEKKPLAKLAKDTAAGGSAFLCDRVRDRGMHYFPSIPIGTGGEVVIQ